MLFDLTKALQDEEYARDLKVGKYEYDDFIFLLSAIYASNVSLSVWAGRFSEDNALLKTLISSCQVIHCQSWEDAICDIADYAGVRIDNSEFKSNKASREWVKERVSPRLLNLLYTYDNITERDVIDTMREVA